MIATPQIRLTRRAALAGFSLIELMIAMVVLAVGLLGGMGIMCVATAHNGRSKLNTTAATLAESTMERILALPQSATGAAALTAITDCAGNTFTIDTVPGGSTLVSGPGFSGVDFTKPAVPNYSMNYTACPAAGGVTYDIRWRIDPGPTPSTQLVTVSAKPLAGQTAPSAVFSLPVTQHAYRGEK